MKLAGISYATSSAMYAVGSRVQVVCKQGYNVSLPNGRQDQIITCLNTGKKFNLVWISNSALKCEY